MDARRLLGLGPGARRAEVEPAHARLQAHLAEAPPELRRAVTYARDRLLGQADGPPRLDAWRLLGVAQGASEAELKVAYRRLAALTHPDRGGNPELFRLVDAAYDLLTGRRHTSAHRRERAQRAPRPHAQRWVHDPPRKPPPPGPYVPPPPDRRMRPSRRRAWRDVAVLGSGLAAVAVAAGWLLGAAGGWAIPLAVLYLWLLVGPARPVLVGFGRAVGRLAPPVHRRGAAPDAFLADTCLAAPVGREHDDDLYAAYVRWCRARQVHPLPSWRFREELRSMGLLLVQASAWDDGVWVGIRLRERVARAV